jgi:DNA-binding CsgD family transcriptional regulator
MHAFSRSLADFYDVAEQAHFEEFPAEVMRFLRQWIGFDGAVLGMGETRVDPQTHLEITHAHVQDRAGSILDSYGRLSAADPVTNAFLKGLPSPMAVDCRALYQATDNAQLDDFSRDFGLRHLMLFGDAPSQGHAGRWLVLYRSDDSRFGAADAEYLHAAWFHISRAIGLNRATLLEAADTAPAQRACALIDVQGRIERADANFLALMRTEWPDFSGDHLPREVLPRVARDGAYRGRQVELSVQRQHGFAVCTAQSLDTMASLTPGENAVARRFAAGMSHKEIARELGVSPHTVRTQITRLYAKLHVHDKAALAQLVIASRDKSSRDTSAVSA